MSQGRAGTARPGRPIDVRERVRVRGLGDRALIDAMRRDDPWAWGEFLHRFRGPLHDYARRTGIPPDDRDECVEQLLDDEALRLTTPGVEPPAHLAAYLVRAVRNRFLQLRRARMRDARIAVAADVEDMQGVVAALCSEDALRGARGVVPIVERAHGTAGEVPDESPGAWPDGPPDGPPDESPDESATCSPALAGLIDRLRRDLSPDDERLLGWLAYGVPHRRIAEWLGIGYDAATKRAWRLTRRLRVRAHDYAATRAGDERAELERFLRRSGAPLAPEGAPAARSGAAGSAAGSGHSTPPRPGPPRRGGSPP